MYPGSILSLTGFLFCVSEWRPNRGGNLILTVLNLNPLPEVRRNVCSAEERLGTITRWLSLKVCTYFLCLSSLDSHVALCNWCHFTCIRLQSV
jgi:hypothetical protein